MNYPRQHPETFQGGGTHRWRHMKQSAQGGGGGGKETNGLGCFSIFTTRTRPFLAELLISSCEGKKNEKSKVFLQKIKGKRSN